MTINVYQIGDLARVSGAFTNIAQVATDPTTVSFRSTTPAGALTTLVYLTDAALVKDSTGNYHVDLSLTAAGWWHYSFVGAGAVQQVEHGELLVVARAA